MMRGYGGRRKNAHTVQQEYLGSIIRVYFSILLRVVSTRNALFEK